MGYYGGGGTSSSRKTYKPVSLGGGSGTLNIDQPQGGGGSGIGKGSIDLTDPVGSLGQTVGAYGAAAAGFVGDAAGAIGSIGFGDGKNIGAIADVPGNVLGALGSIPLPRVRLDGIGDPNAPAATVGDIPGAMLDTITAPGRAVERTIAGQRVEQAQRGELPFDLGQSLAASPTPFGALVNLTRGGDSAAAVREAQLPPDLQERLDAGESVDVIADELVARNAGFSGNAAANLTGQFIFDPLNLIAPGASKVGRGIKSAGMAVRVPERYAQLGLTQRAAGIAYNTAARGLSAGGQAAMDRILGPVTSGALHALGTGSYRRFTSGFSSLDRGYAQAIEDAGAVANANLAHAVLGDEIATDIASGFAKAGDDIGASLGARLTAKRAYREDQFERRAQELLMRTMPEFLDDTDLTEFTVRGLAQITGASVEDAARIVGKATLKDAQTVHWLRYGKAVDEMGEAREAARALGKSNIDLDRLTLVADDTLTVERAAALVSGADLQREAMRYSVIANHFLGKNPSDQQILDFIEKLRKGGRLVEAVKQPKSGASKLPGPLSDFRARWKDQGYELGFAPKDDLKVMYDEDGNVLFAKPFIQQVTRRDPLSMRNPLGRAMDGMFRGITQTTIVLESRQRMTRFVADAGLPISPNQVRSIHQSILEEAADRSLTPRALVGDKSKGEPLYNAIFKAHLSPEEYAELTTRFDPTYLVMHAFAGNWRTVGLTQKLTGAAKTKFPIIAKIAEALYPKARFTYRPTFQLQEMIESPSLNALRGIQPREVSPELAQAFTRLAEQPEFRYLTEASYLNIAGDRMVQRFMGANTAFGRAMGRFTNIQARKEVARVAQVAHEHGEEFQKAVEGIDPKFWAAMEDAYKTTDPGEIAEAFLTERMRLASGDVDDAMAVIDEAVEMASFPRAYDPVGDFMGSFKPLSAELKAKMPPSPTYAYHASPAEHMESIRANGLRTAKPRDGAGAGDEAGVYFGSNGDEVDGLLPRGNKDNVILLRTRKDRLTLTDQYDRSVYGPTFDDDVAAGYTGEYISRQDISPADLEFMGADGAWHPLASQAASPRDAFISKFNALARRVSRAEKEDLPVEQWTPEMRSAYDSGDWEQFSRLRGYTDEEIADYRRFQAYHEGIDKQTLDELITLDDEVGQVADAGLLYDARKAAGLLDQPAKPTWVNSPESEVVWQAFKDSFRQSSVRAFQTHFFNVERGWLERTLNHPYLGLYPLSYMWGKVLPEFARFLIARPFGNRAPLVGLAGLERVQQAYLGALADDEEFRGAMEQNAEFLYFANLLFPGNPTNLTVNTPAWARHISEDLTEGRDVGLDTLAREAKDTTNYAFGPLNDFVTAEAAVSDLSESAQDVFAQLEKAAREFDGQFSLAQ